MEQGRFWSLLATGFGLLVAAVILAFTFHFKRYVSHPWAELPPTDISANEDHPTADFVSENLNKAAKANHVIPGLVLRVLTLYSREDEPTTIYLLEGTLNGKDIGPSAPWSDQKLPPLPVNPWHHLQAPLLFVSSVDRYRVGGGRIGKWVTIGCGIQRVDELKAMTEGTERLDPCQGAYKNALGISWVADMAIYTTGHFAHIYHCSEAIYQKSKCIEQAVDSGFGQLFTNDLPKVERRGTAAVVIPAIGTHRPGNPLSKEDFYDTLTDHLYDALNDQNPLPRTIYLLVWTRESWLDVRDALTVNISNLYDRWVTRNANYVESEPTATPIVGVLGGLGLLLLSVALIPPLRRLRDLNLLVSGPLASTVIGWGLASLGIAAVTHAFLSWIWWDLGVSVLIGFFCGPVLRMSRLFDGGAHSS